LKYNLKRKEKNKKKIYTFLLRKKRMNKTSAIKANKPKATPMPIPIP